MALISKHNFKRIQKERNTVHKQVETTYTSFSDENGNKYFQIDTYGLSDREIRGKVSQSVQFDKKFAEKLIQLLKSEFKIK